MRRLSIATLLVILFYAASTALASPVEQGVAITPAGPVPVLGLGAVGGTTVALTPYGLTGATLLPPTAALGALSGPPVNPAAIALFQTYLPMTGGNPALASYAANFYALTPMGQMYAAQAASVAPAPVASYATQQVSSASTTATPYAFGWYAPAPTQ